MKKRLLAFAAALLLLLPALAQAAGMADLAVITQTDPRFAWENDYRSAGRSLISYGARACSMTNALIAAFGVTDQDQAAALLRESLVYTASHHTPWNNPVDPNSFALLHRTTAEEYPLLTELRSRYALISWQNGVMHGDFLQTQAAPSLEDRTSLLLMGRGYVTGAQVIDFAELARWFSEQGRPDALVILCMVNTSNGKLPAPFGLPEAEHFATVVFPADEFAAEGACYLMDSLPRGLNTVEQQAMSAYACYPLVMGDEFAAVRDSFDVTRLQQGLLRLSLRQDAPTDALQLLGLSGNAIVMVCIP